MYSDFLEEVPWRCLEETCMHAAELAAHQLGIWSSPTHTRMRTTTITNVSVSREAAARMSALWLLCMCVLGFYAVKPVNSSHFMGGLMHWRPVNPAAFDARVSSGTACHFLAL